MSVFARGNKIELEGPVDILVKTEVKRKLLNGRKLKDSGEMRNRTLEEKLSGQNASLAESHHALSH